MARDRFKNPDEGAPHQGEDDPTQQQGDERRRRKTFLPTPAQRERRAAAPPPPLPPPPGEPTVGHVLDTVRATIGEPESEHTALDASGETSVDVNPLERELDDPTQPNVGPAARKSAGSAINYDTQPSAAPSVQPSQSRKDETDIGIGATQRVPKRNAIAALRASLRTTGLDSQPPGEPSAPAGGDWADTQVGAPTPVRPSRAAPEDDDTAEEHATSRDVAPSGAGRTRRPSGPQPPTRRRRTTAGYGGDERDLDEDVARRIANIPADAKPNATLLGHGPDAPARPSRRAPLGQDKTSATLAPRAPAGRRSKRQSTRELGAAAAGARERAMAARAAPAASEHEDAPTRAVVRSRRPSGSMPMPMPTPPPESGGPVSKRDVVGETSPSAANAPPATRAANGEQPDQSTVARHLSSFRRDPADSTAFNALRRAYQGQSREPELAALYERRADHLSEGHGAADLLWRAAEIHHARGNAESELRVLNKAVARDKGHQRALERLKGLAQSTERWTELVRLLELEIEGLAEAGRDARRAARLEFDLGQLWEQRLGRLDRAIACYQRAFAGDASHAEAIEAGRRIYAQVGHFETVAQLYRVELETITDARTKIERLLKLGELYRDKLGDLEAAARCYTEALQLRPGNEELMETLGEIYASPEWPSPGGLDKAASIYMQIAQRRQSRGDRDGAIAYLRRALGADPENEAAATRLERAYQETGRWADLDRLYRQRISVASEIEATQLLMRRAELLERKLGDRQGARECYESVLPREVLGGPASARLKELYRADEDWEKLLAMLQRELDGAKDRNARLKLMMEIALLRRDHSGDPEGAAVLLHEILQIDPEHRKALAAYEDYFRQKGDYRNLSELLRYAAQSAREANAPPMEICARLEELADVCERRLGDLEGAAESWQQIGDLHPDTNRSKESLRRIGVRMRMWQQRKAAMEHDLSQAFGASERLEALRRCAKAYHDQMLDPLDLAEILREILTQSPGDESALRMLVEIYEREADHEGVAWALSHQLDGILTKVERARVLKRLAEVYADQLDRPHDAIAAYQELCELTPHDRAAVSKLQQLLDQADDLEELARVLGRRVEAARSADERLKALKELAELMDNRLEAPARAIECWEDVRALMPHDEEALAALTRLTEDTGDFVKLLSILRQRFEDSIEDPSAPPAPAGATIVTAAAMTPAARAALLKKIAHVAEQKLQRPQDAAAAYEELAALLPASREALEALERLYAQLGRHEQLASVLDRQLELADDAEERVVLAFKQVDVLEGQLGDVDRAADAFERILNELAPADLDAHRRLKQLHLRRNDFARAAEIAERELFLVPDSDERRRDRLELAQEIADLWWRRAQDAQRAQLAYERVLSIDSESVEALRELRRIYHRTESYEELVRRASAIFAAIDNDRERQVLLLELAQVCEERLQDPTRAFEWYRRANDLYPDDGSALTQLRRLAADHEMWEELLAVYRESLRRVIGGAEHLALIFEMSRIADEHLGDKLAAFEILREGLEVDPRGEQLLEPMARIAELGDQQRALYDVYQQVLEREDEPVRRDALLAKRAQLADEALHDAARAIDDEVRRYGLGVCDEAQLIERVEQLARRSRRWGPVLAVHRMRYERAEDDELRLTILEHVAELFEHAIGDRRRAFEVWLRAFGVRKDDRTVGECWRLAGALSSHARGSDAQTDSDGALEVDADDIVAAEEASSADVDPAAGQGWDGPTVAMRQPSGETPLLIEPTKTRRDETMELSLSDAAMMVAVAPAGGRSGEMIIESSKKRRDKTIELSLTDAALMVGTSRKGRKDETMELDGSDILELAAKAIAPPRPPAAPGTAPPPLPPPLPGGAARLSHSSPSPSPADSGEVPPERVAAGESAWQALERAYRAHAEGGVDSAIEVLVEVAGMWSRGAADVERAFDALAEAALLVPGGEVVERELLALAAEHDRFERVIEIYRDLIDHAADAPALMQLHLRLGQLVAEHGELEAAEPHLAAVLAIDPREPRAAASLEALYEKLERYGDLAQLISRQLELLSSDLTPQERGERLTRLANLYEHQLDRPYDAAEALSRLLDENPSDSDSLARLAELYERLAIWPKHIEAVESLIGLTDEAELRAAHALRVARAYHRELELPDRAIEAFERVLEHDPTSDEALEALEGLYRAHEQIEKLAGVLRAQVGLSDDDDHKRAALVRLARALEGLGDHEAAAEQLREARELGDFDPDVEEGLARVLVLAGKADEATALLQAQIARAEREDRGASAIAAIEVRLARLRRDPLGDPEGARATLEAALARAPGQREALTELAGMEAAAGNWDRFSELQADLASQIDDDEAVQLLVGAAHACLSAGAVPAATSLYEGAHALRPEEVSIIDALLSLSTDASSAEQPSAEILARREMLLGRKRPLVEDAGARAALLTELADIRRQRGASRGEVTRLLDSALSAEPDFVPALDALSALHLEHDDMDAARAVLEEAIGRIEGTSASRDAGQLYYRLGDIFERGGRSEDGYKYLMQALRLQPRNLLLRLAVGQNRYRAHRWREALRHLAEAGEHDEAQHNAEASAEALYCAGICERRLRRPERSLPLFERALELSPDHVGALKELASDALDRGHIDEAATRLRRVADVSRDAKERVELLSHLADLYHDQLDDGAASADCYEQLVTALLGATDDDQGLDDEAAALDALPRALPILREQRRHGSAARAAQYLAELFEGRERRDQLLVAALEHDAAATSAQDEETARVHYAAADSCRRGALEIDPTASEAALGLARSLGAREQHDEVVKLLDAHVKKLPPPRDEEASARRAQVYELLARAQHARGNIGRAIEALERRLKLAEDIATRVRLAELYDAQPGRDEAALANHRVLARDLSRTDSLRALAHAARDAGAPYRAFCIDSVLAALDQLDDGGREHLESYQPAALPAHTPYAGEISDADREGLLTGDDLKTMGEVFATLWGAAPTLLPKDLESHGVTSRDRISPAGKEPLALVYSTAARALGIKSTAVYVSEGEKSDPVRVVAMAPPAVIVPRGVAEQCSVSELRFRVGRALELTQPAYIMAEGLERERFAELLRLVLHAFHPRYLRKRPRPTERELSLREEAQQFRRALPYKIARRLGDLLRERASTSFDSGAWREAVDHAATRVGLLLSGDLELVLGWLRQRQPELAELAPRQQIRSSQAVNDLLTFAASDSYYICRVKLGLGGSG